MDTEYYVVVVQDIGERLEYEYTDYDKAVHLMEAGLYHVPCGYAAKRQDGVCR